MQTDEGQYAIVFSSKTGNTKLLAQVLFRALLPENCVYFGAPDEAALAADRLYIGFWTDKGNCDEETAAFLKKVKDKTVFLFGTAGFGGDAAYFERILGNVRRKLDRSCTVAGAYMCQGRMPPSVRERYVRMQSAHMPVPNLQSMIDNFDAALSHPDDADLDRLVQAANDSDARR